MHLRDFNKILVVISTTGKYYNVIEQIVSAKLKEILPEDRYIIRLTEDENSTVDFTNEFINSTTNSLVISAGGDGSINEVSNTIYNSKRDDIYFSFLPNGTGNDFCRMYYDTNDIEKILSNFSGDISEIDMIKFNDTTSINVAAFGFESLVLEKSLYIKDKFPIFRKASFLIGIFTALTQIKPIEYTYEFTLPNGEIISGTKKCIMNAICNGKYYGGGFIPAPKAELNDGILHFSNIDYVGPFRLITLIGKYKTPNHLDLDVSHTIDVIKGRIYSKDKEILGNVDGNLLKFNELNFEVLPRAIKIFVFK